MVNDGRGYHWPVPIDPGAGKCIQVYIPDDPLYLGAFWAAYEHFTKWVAWARDADHTGIAVAEVWRPYFELSRQLYEAGAECGMVELRQDPDNPCYLQINIDDEWVTWADTSLCSEPSSPPHPYPVPIGPENPAVLSAVDVINYFSTIMQYILDQVDAGVPEPTILSDVIADLQPLEPGEDFYPGAAHLLDTLKDLPYAETTAAITLPDTWQPLFEEIACKASNEGHWLDDAAEAIFEFLNTSSEAIFDALSQTAATLTGDGWTRAALLGEGGAGFDSSDFDEPTCELPALKSIYLGPWETVSYERTTPGSGHWYEWVFIPVTYYDPFIGTCGQVLDNNMAGNFVSYDVGGYDNQWAALWPSSFRVAGGSINPPQNFDEARRLAVGFPTYDFGDGRGSQPGNIHGMYYFPTYDYFLAGGNFWPKTVDEGVNNRIAVRVQTNGSATCKIKFRIRNIHLRE